MKLSTIICAIILLSFNFVWGAKGPADVSVGSHNLSSSSPMSGQYDTDEDSICVFCHTPHGGSLDGPLWNRASPLALSSWSHYNSATMSSAIKGLSTSRPPNTESLICLSCHDGSISVNHVLNEPNDRLGAPILGPGNEPNVDIVDFFGFPGSRIGGERGPNSGGTGFLTDDHPISFSYDAVLNSTEYLTGPKYNSLRTVPTAEGLGVRFYGGAAARVECTSCHDPHVDYVNNPEYAPFLITPNTGSALCLACHNK